METRIYLKEVCGAGVLSRANVRKLYQYLSESPAVLDFSGVTFISRSVADEICNMIDTHPSLTLESITEDVDIMLSIVRKGRLTPRRYASNVKISTKINCDTMEDLKNALLSFGS